MFAEPAAIVSAERENYVPLRRADVVDLLCGRPELDADESQALRGLCEQLARFVHLEYHASLERVKNAYAPFEPDRDTVTAAAKLDEQQRDEKLTELWSELGWLLERANYNRLDRQDIEDVLHVASDWGVRVDVDLDVLDRLEVYARGSVTTVRTRRRLWNYYRPEEVQTPTFQRLVVVFRVRDHKRLQLFSDPQAVYLKLFKNIPHTDLEMLLPGTRPKMRWHDRGKVIVPIASGVGVTVTKLLKLGAVAVFAGIYGMLAFGALVVGTIGYGLRSFHGYQKALQRYQLQLSQSLYFQNLGHNAGVLAHLLDEAEEQECREMMLAYYFLWKRAPETGFTREELDRQVEAFLEEVTGRPVDFEVADALDKLRRLKLVEDVQSGDGAVYAVPLEQAAAQLHKAWDNLSATGIPSPTLLAPRIHTADQSHSRQVG